MKHLLLVILISGVSFATDKVENKKDIFSAVKEIKIIFSENGKVNFTAIGNPSALKILGEGAGPSGELNSKDQKKYQGVLNLKMSSLSAGSIALRTKHMKEKYLEVEKFPDANLRLEEIIIPAEKQKFTGKLKLHGEEHSVDGVYSAKIIGDKAEVQANFSLKLTDYKIAIPSFAGVTVAENVDVSVDTKGEIKK